MPGYSSRSVAGSYDNEGIAIFALQFTYYLWLKSVKTGSVFWALCTALSYFYMVRNVKLLYLNERSDATIPMVFIVLCLFVGVSLGRLCVHH